ncbi:MAG: type II secretion system protein [Planctomycetota bacterium]|jgi:prepilin-type N-terminal cleavage/methylation domain-containing protein
MSRPQEIKERSDSSNAFSLIELLVVISITSLLLGIILPTLGRARALAKQTVCQKRLGQWGLGFEIYAAENNNFYPHIDGRDRTDVLPANPEPEDIADWFYGWIDVIPPLMSDRPWRDYDYGQKPGRDTIFQCPSAVLAPDELYTYRPRRTGYFSYAMNSCLELDRNCWAPWASTGNSWHMPSFLKTTRIRSPSRVILLFDQLLDPDKGYGGTRYNSSAGQYCGSYPKAFSARHARSRGLLGGSILYCDYHVEWKQTVWKPDWPDDLEVPPLGDPDWYPY